MDISALPISGHDNPTQKKKDKESPRQSLIHNSSEFDDKTICFSSNLRSFAAWNEFYIAFRSTVWSFPLLWKSSILQNSFFFFFSLWHYLIKSSYLCNKDYFGTKGYFNLNNLCNFFSNFDYFFKTMDFIRLIQTQTLKSINQSTSPPALPSPLRNLHDSSQHKIYCRRF